MQGADKGVVGAVAAANVAEADVDQKDRALLGFAKLVTERANQTESTDVQKLRDVGWTDEEIAEAVYVVAIFAFFNRVADAFGLKDPGYGDEGPPVEPSD